MSQKGKQILSKGNKENPNVRQIKVKAGLCPQWHMLSTHDIGPVFSIALEYQMHGTVIIYDIPFSMNWHNCWYMFYPNQEHIVYPVLLSCTSSADQDHAMLYLFFGRSNTYNTILLDLLSSEGPFDSYDSKNMGIRKNIERRIGSTQATRLHTRGGGCPAMDRPG